MKPDAKRLLATVSLAALFCVSGRSQSGPQITQLVPAQLWQRLEFSISNVPAASNPSDPDVIALDGSFTLPSGRTMSVPAFWYQNYQRGLSGGYGYVTATGSPEWRLGFTPPEPGTYSLSLTIRTNQQVCGAPASASFTVPAGGSASATGYVRVAASRQYLETSDGQALRLVGENVDWPTTGQGTYWFYLDWVRLEQVLPANYAGNWQPSPDAIGLRGPHESLLYVVAPGASFPANATTATLPVQHAATVTLANWPAGGFIAEWYAAAAGSFLGLTRSTVTNGNLTCSLPDYTEDLAGIVYPPPGLNVMGFSVANGFQFHLDSETGGRYLIQKSTELSTWTPFLSVTNTSGNLLLAEPYSNTNARSFFRALKLN